MHFFACHQAASFSRTYSAFSVPCRHCRVHRLSTLVIGRGSNCLFDDRGFRGCIIVNDIRYKHIEIAQGRNEEAPCCLVRVGGGYPINQLAAECSLADIGGLEFAGGIPGTVGGAIFMNAGAEGQVREGLGSLHRSRSR